MFRFDDCVAYIASNALKRITDTFNDVLLENGSTRVQWVALYYIAAHEGINQSDLARTMNVRTPTVVRLIDRLEKERYVERIPDETDRRVVHLRCTERGKHLNEEMQPVGEAFSAAITKGIEQTDLDTFIAVLNAMVRNSEEIKK